MLMRTIAAITFLALLLPLQVRAQPVELTLICQGETAFNLLKDRNLPLPWLEQLYSICADADRWPCHG